MYPKRWEADKLVAPEWLNDGDNAWQLTAATLVGLQSIPGLMIIYAGMGKFLFFLYGVCSQRCQSKRNGL